MLGPHLVLLQVQAHQVVARPQGHHPVLATRLPRLLAAALRRHLHLLLMRPHPPRHRQLAEPQPVVHCSYRSPYLMARSLR